MAGHTHPHSHSHSRHNHSHDIVRAQDHRAPVKEQKRYKPTDFDMDKLRSTIKQFVRDWSEEVSNLILFPPPPVTDRATGTARTRCLLPAHERRSYRAFL